MITRGPRRQRPSVVLLLGLLLVTALSAPARAADDPVDPVGDDQPAIALRLSPAVLEIPDGAGPSHRELRVDNLGSQPFRVITELSEFTVTEDGTTLFLGPDEVSATAWAHLDVDTFELAPGEQRGVNLTVEVPDDAEPGERYLSVIFAVPGDPDGGGNISVTHQVAVKVYVSVPGERIEHLELGELSGPRMIDSGPATFELTVNNRGNVHRRFEEDTRLLVTSGTDNFAFENFTVLGDSTRVVQAVWPDPPLLCWCTIEVEVDDGLGNLLTASTSVIAFPLRLSLALITLTVGLAILATGRRRHRQATLDRKLDAARREGADAQTARDLQPQRRPSPRVPPTAPLGRPTAPLVTSAGTSSPRAHGATATIPNPLPTTGPRPFEGTMFTAQGTHGRRRRRRG